MTQAKEPRERLAAILAADVVGYSRLMRGDERATVATLDEHRGVFRQFIEAHGGRIVDMAGDSVLAIFESATGAVRAAAEAQAELAVRNEALPEDRKMAFRVGVNLGDILEKEDGSIYGDGVNVAARLEAMANPGGINVSGSVFESVRAKIGGPFAFLGEHALKNIADPVAVYHLGTGGGEATAADRARTGPGAPNVAERPTVAVLAIKVISGDSEIASLAEGLHQDIVGGLTQQTAIAVVSGAAGDGDAADHIETADFRLEGSVRASGERLRLSFSLFDSAAGSQVWSERYQRHLDDIFDLEDEISLSVASAVRIRIKARAFEKLRDTANDALSVPNLLSKAAGYFINSYGNNKEAAAALDVALTRKPDNSMAIAMSVFCRYRAAEFSVLDIPDGDKAEMADQVQAALGHDQKSFFAHLIAALVQQDLFGDYPAALVHAETALDLNSSFSQATTMVGIAKCHLGDTDAGLRLIETGIEAAPEDPHRWRHHRELAVAQFVTGDSAQALATIDRLVQLAPDLGRNRLVLAALQWQAGQTDKARQLVAELRDTNPTLSLQELRPVRIGDPDLAARFQDGLASAGLPS